MDISEINDISDSFLEAWIEFFGAPMYLVPIDVEASQSSPIDIMYNEATQYKYKEDQKVMFHGSLRDHESLDEEVTTGYHEKSNLTLVLISKELVDKGHTLSITDLVEFTDSNGVIHSYRITDITKRVQFLNYRIFTRLKLVKLSDVERGVL